MRTNYKKNRMGKFSQVMMYGNKGVKTILTYDIYNYVNVANVKLNYFNFILKFTIGLPTIISEL